MKVEMNKRKPSEIPASLKTIDVKSILRSRGVYLQQKVNREMKAAAIPMARKLIQGKKKEAERYLHFSNEEAIAYRQKQIHIIEVIEKRFELKVQQFVTKIVNGFLAHLESEIAVNKVLKSTFKAKDFFDDSEDDFLATAQLDFTPLLVDQAVLAGQEALKLIHSDDVYTPYDLRKRIAQNVNKFTQSMLDTDKQKLIDILLAGVEEGQSVPEIRGAIEADFDNISKMQAEVITRTEVSRVSNQGALDAWKQSGLVEGKQWVTQGAIDECADYDGQVESLDGNFYSDTTEFADGDPPLHPNCRCGTIPVLLEENKSYIPDTKILRERIIELESQIDKRTKEFRELKKLKADDEIYIKALENLTND